MYGEGRLVALGPITNRFRAFNNDSCIHGWSIILSSYNDAANSEGLSLTHRSMHTHQFSLPSDHLSFYPSFHPSTLPSIHFSFCLSIHPSFLPSFHLITFSLFISSSSLPSFYLSTFPLVQILILPYIQLPTFPSIHLPSCSNIDPPLHPATHLSVYPPSLLFIY